MTTPKGIDKSREPQRKINGVMLLLTYRFNLNCVYCYEPKKLTKEMSLDVANEIIVKGFKG